MSRDISNRRLTDLLRQASAQSLLISQAIASKARLNTTDLECLDILQMQGQASAGGLAKATGLTTGAVTALLDRLEKAGFIRRLPDPADRRRVLAAPDPEKMRALFEMYAPLQERMEALYRDYDDEQLELIIGFMNKSCAISRDFVGTLQKI
ncbi:MarR family transcriptional regulator [Agrobacterium rhizogenes]|uniref:MarR family winged helix-turn-helix transcriptional regulator n=1 Tax=Rhizobium rhizogenes TaxID=359 RepID=UPI0022B6B208|nr:MarR family transcriptional regulator [Rhizobium rhizogenes]MCZ7448584.1 MarR family transcriptional regulator [Rhizobium rhizogenes]